MNRNRSSARPPLSRQLATLACGLLVTALFAPTAQAISILEVDVDPGVVGSEAGSLQWSTQAGEVDEVVVIRFTDGKQLGFPGGDPPVLSFQVRNLNTLNGVGIAGFLLDENDTPIEGTAFSGLGCCLTDLDPFPPGTVWSGVLLTGFFGSSSSGVAYSLNWAAATTPAVIPEPGTALLMGLGLTGLAARGRSRR